MNMRILESVGSNDGATRYLLELHDQLRVESVFLVMDHDGKDSLCVSSQVGCALACRFCTTGLIGYQRDLTAAEIVEQVRLVLTDQQFVQRRRFDLSYMGMGEPLYNLDAVVQSKVELSRLHPDFRFYLSTVGIPGKILKLAELDSDFGLQISLHAPDDTVRTSIMPINRAHRIDDLLAAGETYAGVCRYPVTLNYCLMSGVNDGRDHARGLAELVRGRPFRVQLVNFNPHISFGYQPTTDDHIQMFLETLAGAGVRAHHGRQLGNREGAGCGQLDADYETGALSRGRRTLPVLASD